MSAAKLTEVTDRYAHTCPHCPKDLEEWVVHLDDVIKLVRECGIEVTQ